MFKPAAKYILNNHILFTVLLIALGFFLFQIKGILVALFIAYIIMASVNPFVRILRRYRVPKVLAISLIYVFVLLIIILLVIPIITVSIQQIHELFKVLPKYIESLSETLGIQLNFSSINSLVGPFAGSAGENILGFTSKIFGGIFSVVSIFVLSFYMLLDRERLGKAIPALFPKEYQEKTILTIHLVEQKLGAWLRGQLVLSVTVGVLTWIILTLMHIPYAVPLAILAGFLEIIPTLGPIIAAIPAAIVGFAISPLMGLAVVLAYTAIQVAENHILVPKIMQKAVGLNPVIIIVAILIGAQLMGVVGALISIPLISAGIIIFKAYR